MIFKFVFLLWGRFVVGFVVVFVGSFFRFFREDCGGFVVVCSSFRCLVIEDSFEGIGEEACWGVWEVSILLRGGEG